MVKGAELFGGEPERETWSPVSLFVIFQTRWWDQLYPSPQGVAFKAQGSLQMPISKELKNGCLSKPCLKLYIGLIMASGNLARPFSIPYCRMT